MPGYRATSVSVEAYETLWHLQHSFTSCNIETTCVDQASFLCTVMCVYKAGIVAPSNTLSKKTVKHAPVSARCSQTGLKTNEISTFKAHVTSPSLYVLEGLPSGVCALHNKAFPVPGGSEWALTGALSHKYGARCVHSSSEGCGASAGCSGDCNQSCNERCSALLSIICSDRCNVSIRGRCSASC